MFEIMLINKIYKEIDKDQWISINDVESVRIKSDHANYYNRTDFFCSFIIFGKEYKSGMFNSYDNARKFMFVTMGWEDGIQNNA